MEKKTRDIRRTLTCATFIALCVRIPANYRENVLQNFEILMVR